MAEAEMSFMFTFFKFNTTEPSLANIPHKPTTWKRSQGQTTNLGVIYCKRIKLFSAPKAKRKKKKKEPETFLIMTLFSKWGGL